MGWLSKAQDKIEAAIDRAATCNSCGCSPQQSCGNCTASDCYCTPVSAGGPE